MEVLKYRAKVLNTNESVIGYVFPDGLDFRIKVPRRFIKVEGIEMPYEPIIDFSTLAMHLEDMFDKDGKEIFASLNMYGKGGDILDKDGVLFYVMYKASNKRFEAYEINGELHLLGHEFHQTKIVGEYNGSNK